MAVRVGLGSSPGPPGPSRRIGAGEQFFRQTRNILTTLSTTQNIFKSFQKVVHRIYNPNSGRSDQANSAMIQLGLLSTYRVGQTVEYFSAAHNSWMPGVILGFNPDGSVNLNNQAGVPVESLRTSQTLVSMPQVHYLGYSLKIIHY